MDYSKNQLTGLVVLRMLVGWHFLYEGLWKLFTPAWTSAGYLRSAEGLFKPLFSWFGSSSMVGLSDTLVTLGLIGIGLSLLLGLFTRVGAIAGMLLLAMFYLAHSSFPGAASANTADGHFLIVNKNLIEFAAMWVILLFPTSQYVGLDMYLGRKKMATA
jgi:thiosulfate dehydrogenase [quinone] large subunit